MSKLLEDLPEPARTSAVAVLADCTALALPRGTQRTAGRVPRAELLVLEEGLVVVASMRPGASRRMVVSLSAPGALLLPPGPGERIEALADSWLTVVTAPARDELLRIPEAAAALVVGLAESLRASRENVGNFASIRHVERVRDKLLQLARDHGRVVSGGIRLDLPLTHELLGEMVGSARETVTWALAQLAREGFVCRDGRFYRLAVPPDVLAS